jgi:flagellin-like protein
MKILKSRKALSPVVASIILIAVTVAVSLAVAVWMGSLTTGQMQTEGISFVNYAWASPSGQTIANITITIKNTGSADLSVAEVKVDNTVITESNLRFNGAPQSLPYSLPKGSEVSITIIYTFQRGTTYNFYVRTSRGNVFGPYTLPAP